MEISKGIGIDLGTTNSAVGIMDLTDTQVTMYEDKTMRRKTTPSVVAYDPRNKQILVGHVAFRRIGILPEPIVSIKRKMGTAEKVQLGPYAKTPTEISAIILSEMKRQIAEELKEENPNTSFLIDRAIITIPAYFVYSQIEATREAGHQAGLEVLELLQEPTAAAIYYAWKYNISNGTFMVFDLGGGTFDVSILQRVAGEYQVLGIGGDNYLGGDDFDRILAAYILLKLVADRYSFKPELLKMLHLLKDYPNPKELCKSNKLSPNFLEEFMHTGDQQYAQISPEEGLKFTKLISLAEGVKKDLSSNEVVRADNQNLFQDEESMNVIVDMEITRKELEDLIRHKVDSTIPCCVLPLIKNSPLLNNSSVPPDQEVGRLIPSLDKEFEKGLIALI